MYTFPIEQLTSVFIPRLITFLVMIVAAVLSGIIVAVKNNEFELVKIGDFLRTIVVPMLGGWLLLEGIALLAAPETIPAENGWTHGALQALAYSAYTASFLSLIGRILANLYELDILPKVTATFARKE
jgi:hypothetical protein